MDPLTVFFLVRHGEALSNTLRIPDAFPGDPSIGLTEKGFEESKRIASQICESGLDILFTSPMRRTRETAEVVASVCGDISLRFDRRLRETDFGVWSGTSYDEFLSRYPSPLNRIEGNPVERLEGLLSIRERISEFLRDTSAEYAGKHITIVSHSDPLAQLRGVLMGESIEQAVTGWQPSSGQPVRIDVDTEMLTRIVSGK